jgi:hypothetical protein
MSIFPKNQYVVIIAGILFSVCILTLFYYFLESRYVNAIDALVTEREASLHAYADHLISNTAPEEIRGFGEQCTATEQAELDQNLDSLATLSDEQLHTTQFLLFRCAYYYPHQQSLLARLLEESFDSYSTLVHAHDESTFLVSSPVPKIPVWQEIVLLERTRTQNLVDLVDIQMQIISLLIDGQPGTSEEIQSLRDSSITMRREMVSLRSKTQELRGVVREL